MLVSCMHWVYRTVCVCVCVHLKFRHAAFDRNHDVISKLSLGYTTGMPLARDFKRARYVLGDYLYVLP